MNPEIYKNLSHGRPKALTEAEELWIVNYVTSSQGNWEKTALELMKDLEFPYSESTFKQCMYDHGYE